MGQGLGSNKMCYLARLMHATKAQVTFVSEIKSSNYSSSDLNQHFDMDNSLVVPSKGRPGGLWMMWTDDRSQLPVHRLQLPHRRLQLLAELVAASRGCAVTAASVLVVAS